MTPFPRPAGPMMAARKAAFEPSLERRFDRQLFATQAYHFQPSDNTGHGRAALIDLAVDYLATYPDGTASAISLSRVLLMTGPPSRCVVSASSYWGRSGNDSGHAVVVSRQDATSSVRRR